MITTKSLYENLDRALFEYTDVHSLLARKYKMTRFKLDLFGVYLHKKLMYFQFAALGKFYNFSVGQILRKRIKKLKFFKKSIKNLGITINLLNKKVSKYLKSINVFYCKNFNLKNFLFVKKLLNLIQPKINYLFITKSWNSINKKKRRIKKKILRNLLKNTTRV